MKPGTIIFLAVLAVGAVLAVLWFTRKRNDGSPYLSQNLTATNAKGGGGGGGGGLGGITDIFGGFL